jgi:hypothetical protein
MWLEFLKVFSLWFGHQNTNDIAALKINSEEDNKITTANVGLYFVECNELIWMLVIIGLSNIFINYIDKGLCKIHRELREIETTLAVQITCAQENQLTTNKVHRSLNVETFLRCSPNFVYTQNKWLLVNILLVLIHWYYNYPLSDKDDQFDSCAKILVTIWLVKALGYYSYVKFQGLLNFIKQLRLTDIVKVLCIVVLLGVLPGVWQVYSISVNNFNEKSFRTVLVARNRPLDQHISVQVNDTQLSNGVVWTSVMVSAPFSRFDTEDVRFVCDFHAYVPEEAQNIQVDFEWFHNYKALRTSNVVSNSRFALLAGPQTWLDTIKRRRLFQGKQDLLLLRITKSDYGKYLCMCNIFIRSQDLGEYESN